MSKLIPTFPFPDHIQSMVLAHESPVDIAKTAKLQADSMGEEEHLTAVFANGEPETVIEQVFNLYKRENYFATVNGRILMKACFDQLNDDRTQIRGNDYDTLGRLVRTRNLIDGVLRQDRFTTYHADTELVVQQTTFVMDGAGRLMESILFTAQQLPHQDNGKSLWEAYVTIDRSEDGKWLVGKLTLLGSSVEVTSKLFDKYCESEWQRQDAVPATSARKDSYGSLVDRIRQGY